MLEYMEEGKVRLVSDALKSEDNMAMVQGFISTQDGVKNFTPDTGAGVALIEYDPAIVTKDILEEAAVIFEAQFPETEKKTRKTATKNSAAKKPQSGISRKGAETPAQGTTALVICEAKDKKKPCGPLMTTKTELTLLSGALTLTVASLMFSKRIHALAGVSCLGLMGYHIYKRYAKMPYLHKKLS
jgi:hypothetical protein